MVFGVSTCGKRVRPCCAHVWVLFCGVLDDVQMTWYAVRLEYTWTVRTLGFIGRGTDVWLPPDPCGNLSLAHGLVVRKPGYTGRRSCLVFVNT